MLKKPLKTDPNEEAGASALTWYALATLNEQLRRSGTMRSLPGLYWMFVHWAISLMAFNATESCAWRLVFFQDPRIGRWSVKTVRDLPLMRSMKWRMANLMARSSRLYVLYFCCSGRLQNPSGRQAPSTHWSKEAPRQTCEASVDNARGAEGTGKF